MVRKNLEISVIDFTQSIGLLMRRVRAAAASHELSLTEAAVMARLANDGPATTADLARAEGMKPQSMGASLAQMEEEGIVKRKAHPTDGRQILYELTAAGIDGRYKSRLAKREWLLSAITKLEKDEQQTLFSAIGVIKRLAES